MYAKLVIDVKSFSDQVFSYGIAENMKKEIQIGQRVLVDFGRMKNKEAYVTGFCDSIDFSEHKLKYIQKILDPYPLLTEDLLDLCYFMKKKYMCNLISCIKTVCPSQISGKNIRTLRLKEWVEEEEIVDFFNENPTPLYEDFVREFGQHRLNSLRSQQIISVKNESKISEKKIQYYRLQKDMMLEEINNPLHRKIAEFIQEKTQASAKEICDLFEISISPIQTMLKKSYITKTEAQLTRDVVTKQPYLKKKVLLDKQQEIVSNILTQSSLKTQLIYGITGSGKTEIYMELVEHVLREGKQAIVLVPEISLSVQTVRRFSERFQDKISLTHSKLSASERFDQWKKAKDGKIEIMIGPRSAVFTPFEKLGIIIIDEEHDASYLSEHTPKYDCKEIAIKRSLQHGARVILGSATPSLESFYKAKNQIYDLHVLKERAKQSSLPTIEIIDMTMELKRNNRSIFSKALIEGIQECMVSNQQVMLFLNRRGYSSFVSCRNCGAVLTCSQCDISYTYHKQTKRMICHYCGENKTKPTTCPQCSSKHIREFGIGTEKVCEELNLLFPKATVLRMDFDTTRTKNAYERILTSFRKQEADILVGTQMIAKGHDFPNVTLVGVLAADMSLNMGDFRASELSYQLLTQVAGRAGRSKKKGRVLLQTYMPENNTLKAVVQSDYEDFYQQEISLRKKMNYPPFFHILVIQLTYESEKELIRSAHLLKDMLIGRDRIGFEVLGPAPCQVYKIKNKIRYRIICKHKDEEKLCEQTLSIVESWALKWKNISWSVTLNPFTIT